MSADLTLELPAQLPTALRQRREKLVLDHFADEVSQHWDDVLATFPHPRYELIPTGVVHEGREDVQRYYRETRHAFPDQRHEMIRLRHADDAIVCEFYLLGTHRGTYGGIPATGKSFKVRMTAFFIFEGETLVCERIYFDTFSFLRQLLAGLKIWRPKDCMILLRTLKALGSMGKPAAPAPAGHAATKPA